MVLDIENLSITLTSKSIGLKEELVSLFFFFNFMGISKSIDNV